MVEQKIKIGTVVRSVRHGWMGVRGTVVNYLDHNNMYVIKKSDGTSWTDTEDALEVMPSTQVEDDNLTSQLVEIGYKEALEQARFALSSIMEKLQRAKSLDMKLGQEDEYLRLIERADVTLTLIAKVLGPSH